jgi:protein-L-isoaspartate(D-aspartate) O-methyltransferase
MLAPMTEAETTASARAQMIERQLVARGFDDARILRAFGEVPRHEFVPEELVDSAYHDRALPLGHGQTISQPFVVAVMLGALSLRTTDRVLEIGTGSGYAAALLGRLCAEVYTIERLPELARSAQERLVRLGCANVRVRAGDGTLGWPEEAPFDAVLVSAGGPQVPPALLEQLGPNGRLVMPLGPVGSAQELIRIVRGPGGELERQDLGAVQFVPLVAGAA